MGRRRDGPRLVTVTVYVAEPPRTTDVGGMTATSRFACHGSTVTVKLPVAELPRVSDAVQVTGVAPTGNTVPDALEQVTGRIPSTRSTAVAGAYVTTAPEALVAATVMGVGRVSTGFVVSTTVTSNEAVPTLPAASVAVQVTLVVVMSNGEPDAGEHVTGRLPETLSWAVAVTVTTAPSGP